MAYSLHADFPFTQALKIIKTLFNIKKLGENQISADEKGISVVRFDKSIPASKEEVDNLSKVLADPFNQSIQSDITFALISKLFVPIAPVPSTNE